MDRKADLPTRTLLEIPPAQRITGVVRSVLNVHQALGRVASRPGVVRDLQEQIEAFAATPLKALPR